jgi:hypothetical protein
MQTNSLPTNPPHLLDKMNDVIVFLVQEKEKASEEVLRNPTPDNLLVYQRAAYSLSHLIHYRDELVRNTFDENPVYVSPDIDHKKLMAKCREMISDGLSLSALRLYKQAVNCSIQQAKEALNL